MDKEILVQYCEMIAEIKDIRNRISALEKRIDSLTVVSDSVKGTRKDGTYGSIRITGYPTAEYERKRQAVKAYERLLDKKEADLLELMIKAEEYIQSINRSEIRMMFRFYYIDGLPWWKVAQEMNKMYPKRSISFTEESCKKRNTRYFENVQQCPDEKC